MQGRGQARLGQRDGVRQRCYQQGLVCRQSNCNDMCMGQTVQQRAAAPGALVSIGITSAPRVGIISNDSFEAMASVCRGKVEVGHDSLHEHGHALHNVPHGHSQSPQEDSRAILLTLWM